MDSCGPWWIVEGGRSYLCASVPETKNIDSENILIRHSVTGRNLVLISSVFACDVNIISVKRWTTPMESAKEGFPSHTREKSGWCDW
jgi:hypothetical protein